MLSFFCIHFVVMSENTTEQKAVLLLEDGTVFYGKAAGAIGTTTGEIAFNTGMTGYQEIFTDPSYYGQNLVMATSHIGNYGVHDEEVESEGVKIAGAVCKKFSRIYSRVGGSGSLQEYFERDGIVSICDVDTRAIVRHIRHKGAMNCIISSEEFDEEKLKKQLSQVPSMEGLSLAGKVTCKSMYELGSEDADFRVALVDYGLKKNIARMLVERGCRVAIFPMSTSVEEMLAWGPDGFLLSNGPGDPSAMSDSIAQVKQIVDTGKPVFGICLGHQLLASSQGLGTEKMFNGHRGINHPVLNVESGKGEITSQNHGFVVKTEDAENDSNIDITHIHLNDRGVQGIRLKDKPAFSVQYHPEASPGPHDSRYLFDEFIGSLKKEKSAIEA